MEEDAVKRRDWFKRCKNGERAERGEGKREREGRQNMEKELQIRDGRERKEKNPFLALSSSCACDVFPRFY